MVISRTFREKIPYLISIILIKYENNLNFEDELNSLEKIILPNRDIFIEKIRVIVRKPYKGHYFLEDQFQLEMENYIKNKIEKNNKNFLYKIILPYVKIEPSQYNKIKSSDSLLLINIKKLIKEKQIVESMKKLKLLDKYEGKMREQPNESRKEFMTKISKELKNININNTEKTNYRWISFKKKDGKIFLEEANRLIPVSIIKTLTPTQIKKHTNETEKKNEDKKSDKIQSEELNKIIEDKTSLEKDINKTKIEADKKIEEADKVTKELDAIKKLKLKQKK